MAITINGSGTVTGITAGGLPDGSVTTDDIAAAAVTDAKIASGVSSSKLSGALPALDGSALTNLPGGGKVLQVVTGTLTTQTETSSSSFVTTNLDVNITPSATTSKVLVMASGCYEGSGSHLFTIYRDTTDLGNNTWGFGYNATANGWAMQYLDSPSTTSQITYAVYHRNNNSNAGRICPNNGMSTIIAMEIDGS